MNGITFLGIGILALSAYIVVMYLFLDFFSEFIENRFDISCKNSGNITVTAWLFINGGLLVLAGSFV